MSDSQLFIDVMNWRLTFGTSHRRNMRRTMKLGRNIRRYRLRRHQLSKRELRCSQSVKATFSRIEADLTRFQRLAGRLLERIHCCNRRCCLPVRVARAGVSGVQAALPECPYRSARSELSLEKLNVVSCPPRYLGNNYNPCAGLAVGRATATVARHVRRAVSGCVKRSSCGIDVLFMSSPDSVVWLAGVLGRSRHLASGRAWWNAVACRLRADRSGSETQRQEECRGARSNTNSRWIPRGMCSRRRSLQSQSGRPHIYPASRWTACRHYEAD